MMMTPLYYIGFLLLLANGIPTSEGNELEKTVNGIQGEEGMMMELIAKTGKEERREDREDSMEAAKESEDASSEKSVETSDEDEDLSEEDGESLMGIRRRRRRNCLRRTEGSQMRTRTHPKR